MLVSLQDSMSTLTCTWQCCVADRGLVTESAMQYGSMPWPFGALWSDYRTDCINVMTVRTRLNMKILVRDSSRCCSSPYLYLVTSSRSCNSTAASLQSMLQGAHNGATVAESHTFVVLCRLECVQVKMCVNHNRWHRHHAVPVQGSRIY